MMAEALAAVSVTPFPLYTDIAPGAADGLMQEKTGMPILSRSVMLATRVIPQADANCSTRLRVSSGDTARCVSFLYSFLQDPRIMCITMYDVLGKQVVARDDTGTDSGKKPAVEWTDN